MQLAIKQHLIALPLREKIASALLVILSVLCYALYVSRVISTNMAYAIIVACFVYVLVVVAAKRGGKTLSDKLLLTGLAITCVADIFLGFLSLYPACIEIGVTLFLAVQIIYSARMSATRNGRAAFCDRHFLNGLYVRAAVIVAFVALLLAVFWNTPQLHERAYLYVMTAVYIANAVVNVWYAVAYLKQNPLVFAGLLLLLVCDVLLGLIFLGVPLQKGYFASVRPPWLFYIPSQVLLALSVLRKQ